jgi:hypothetical protein
MSKIVFIVQDQDRISNVASNREVVIYIVVEEFLIVFFRGTFNSVGFSFTFDYYCYLILLETELYSFTI